MRHSAWVRLLFPTLLVLAAGCAENSMVLQGKMDQMQQQQLAVSRQNQELQTRAGTLDRDNQELEKMLAQSQQRGKVLDDQIAVIQDQLGGVTSQLARIQEEKEASDRQVQTLTASMRRQGGVAIYPNNSLSRSLPVINLPDVQVRRDGDVIRIELPGDRLFEPGSAKFLPAATNIITAAALELVRSYPNQIVGIEGHTDSDPVSNWQWQNNHQLSASRAMAVHNVLVMQTRLQAEQLFIVGHGPNHPVVSNASNAGKQRNRRVELVIYPDTYR